MPVTYHIDRGAGMLFVFADGMITQAERIGAIRAWMPLVSAVARGFRALTACGPLEVGVFRNRQDARAWLQQPAR